MKIDQLALALTLVSAALLTCVVAILVLQIGSVLPPDYAWSDIASDWGSVIGGSMALVGAGLTVWKLQHQIEQSLKLEERREARDYANEIRSFEAHLNEAQHVIMTNIIVSHHFVAKGEPHHVEDADAFVLRDFPIGRLPKEVRPKATFAIISMRDFGRRMAKRQYLIDSFLLPDEEMLTRYDKCEVALLATRAAMEGYAREITSKLTLDINGKVCIRGPIEELGLKLRIAAYCRARNINLHRDAETIKLASLFPLSNADLPGEIVWPPSTT